MHGVTMKFKNEAVTYCILSHIQDWKGKNSNLFNIISRCNVVKKKTNIALLLFLQYYVI